MPASDFNLFMAFNRISPFGRERADLNAATVAAAATNIHLPRKDKVKLDAFMPKFRKDPPKPWNHAAFFSALDGQIARQKKRGS